MKEMLTRERRVEATAVVAGKAMVRACLCFYKKAIADVEVQDTLLLC